MTKYRDLPKSKGILDDHAIRKTIALRQGTIEHTPTEEKDITNKEYVDSVAGRSSIDLFITEDASDIGSYFDLVVNVDTSAKQNIVQSITANSTTLIGSFVSVLNEAEVNAIELLESGIYDLHIHAEGAVAKNLFLYFEFYHRTSGGTETLLGTSHDSGQLTTNEAQYELHTTVTTDQAFVSGDRIVIKVYGKNNGSAARNVTIYMEGDTASRTEFPGIIPPDFVAPHVSTHETGGTDAISHDSIDDVSADDHHAEIHTIVSHDTSATGAELDTLTDNSVANTLHRHSELVASDGSPDPALQVDTLGRVNIGYDLIVDSDLLFVDVSPGYVGIGTATPGEMLDVVGNAEINGNIIVTGTVDGIDIATDVAANTTHRGLTNNPHITEMIDDTTPELGGEMDAGAHTIGFTQQSATGDGTTTIDWKLGNKFYFTFGNQNDTFTFTAPSNPCNLILVLKQYSTGGKIPTFPAAVLWSGGSMPTFSTGNNAVDIVAFYYDGTNYFGVETLDFS